MPEQPRAGDLRQDQKGLQGAVQPTIHGGAAFVWPLIQDYAYLSLEPIQIEIPLRGALSSENIRVNVPSVFTVAIDTEPAVMQQAAIRLLGLSVGEIRKQAEEIIFGQLRQVIASMGIEEINRDRDKFLEHIQDSLEPELSKIGLQLINVNITDITDESGYIDAIGQKAASEAIQKARGDVADNERMGETASPVPSATRRFRWPTPARNRRSVRARPNATRRFASPTWKENRSSARQQACVRTRIAGQGSRASDACPGGRCRRRCHRRRKPGPGQGRRFAGRTGGQAEPKPTSWVKAANAKRKRPCWKSRTERWPRPRLAEAERVEAEQRAKLEAPAKAEKAEIVVDAEAEAERKRIDAMAEADAIFAKLDAEARGQYEILAKKGEGLRADRRRLAAAPRKPSRC